jgi:wyosine [tRNA(Phe)-imidazoG37] synthetase (radical SAM superfamily)
MENGHGGQPADSQGPWPAPSRVYGPVPSRRLGRSLGVDIVPFKTCPYNCVYCQLGPTTHHTAARARFFPVADVLAETLERTTASRPDFITVSGSGEPTLCTDLGTLIAGIKTATNVPVALLTNGALFSDPAVREEAAQADVVLPSLDAGDEAFFRWVNRPVASLSLESVTEGLVRFREAYRGRIWLEVMVLRDYTEGLCRLARIAGRARRIRPEKIQLNTPVRPGPLEFVQPVPRDRLAGFCGLFEPAADVIADEKSGAALVSGASAEAERILALLRRRPCTLEDVCAGLGAAAPGTLKVLGALVDDGRVRRRLRDGRTFYQAERFHGGVAERDEP